MWRDRHIDYKALTIILRSPEKPRKLILGIQTPIIMVGIFVYGGAQHTVKNINAYTIVWVFFKTVCQVPFPRLPG